MAYYRRECHVIRMVMASCSACIGSLCVGHALGYSSSALLDLEAEVDSNVRFTKSQGSWFDTLLNVGAIIGGPLGGWLMEALGRKGGLMYSSVPFELGWFLITSAQNHVMLYFGRFCTGLGVGMVSLIVPVYIAEISSAEMRGALCTLSQLSLTTGLLLSFSFGTSLDWRWLAFTGGVFPFLLVFLMLFMPETPVWSMSHDKRDDAIKALKWLKSPDIDVPEECPSNENKRDNERMTCFQFCEPSVLQPLFLAIMILTFQQFCGVNEVLLNCASIFKNAGFEHSKAVSMIISTMEFCASTVACFLMDKVGRKVLLWTAGIGMAVSLIALGVYFEIYIPKDGSPTRGIIHGIHHSVDASKISWLAILSLVIFFLCFALAWGPIPWVLVSELFPLEAKGIAGSIASSANWAASFIVTKVFADFQSALPPSGKFLCYGCISLAASGFVLFFLPETKGKTLEEIESFFDEDKASYERIFSFSKS